jgi:hypothetical protein
MENSGRLSLGRVEMRLCIFVRNGVLDALNVHVLEFVALKQLSFAPDVYLVLDFPFRTEFASRNPAYPGNW